MEKERETGKVVERNKVRDPEGVKAKGGRKEGRASIEQDSIAMIKVSASV